MDAEDKNTYTELLHVLRTALEAELNQDAAESAPVLLDGTMGRVSRGDAMQVQQIALEVKRRREERLRMVRRALSRLERDTYGFCENCRNPIDSSRLTVYPETARCIRCATV
ncbi:MAG: TraR/DksA C4-type zinc finger protein [Verrucomicrobia bacterium]|nr:TraR/DksA C4-type zinc finger protein [Verrucomicrobiota bacterium]